MKSDKHFYDQPVKNQVREQVLSHAVEALTKHRDDSPVVNTKQFFQMLDYCQSLFKKSIHKDIYSSVDQRAREWHSLHDARIGRKSAGELQVLILCGPDPLNDFRVLLDLGISIENIWAIEGDTLAFKRASERLREADLSAKLHNGSLKDFFAVIPQQFDIVYFDACGPLLGGKPNTHDVLRELFLQQRLAPLSVLITNFSIANQDGNHGREWAKRLAVWYAARYDEPVGFGKEVYERMSEPDLYYDHIEKNLHDYYSDFVTRFIIEFGSQLLPWWRVVALPAARREYFSSPDKLKIAIRASLGDTDHLFSFDGNIDDLTSSDRIGHMVAKIFEGYGLAQVASELFPHLWVAERTRELLDGNDPMKRLFHSDRILQTSLSDALSAVSIIHLYDMSRQNDREACSTELANILDNFRWFDSNGQPWERMFCDIPFPNLIIDSLLGLYGYPYHANANKLLRLEYTAKVTRMFTDVFVFDQARYFYDLLPTLALFEITQRLDFQLILRICMDAIRRHTFFSCPTLFRGSSLAGLGTEEFKFYDLPVRLSL